MNERHPIPPAKSRRQRATALTCTALAASMLLGALPVHAQDDDDAKATQRAVAAANSPALRSRTPVTLNFVNADVDAVSRAMGAMLDRPIIVDPRVRGQVTVFSDQPLSVRDAYLNFLAALRGIGATVVENAGLLKVVPEADAKLQAGTVSVGTPSLRGDQIVTQVFRLNYENANNMVTVLRPLISPNNTINANPGNNTLVITDYADNLQRMSRIIAALDTASSTDVDVVQLKHAIASDMATLVQRLADGGGGGFQGGANVPGVASAGGVSVLADARSNSLIIRAGNPAKLATVRNIIAKLDQPNGSAGPAGNIYVVYLRNADAAKLATVLRAAFAANSGGAGGGGASSGGATGSSGLNTPNAAANANSQNSSSTSGAASTQSTSPVQASAGPSTGGFVQADPSTNSLIITAPEPMYRQIRAVIDQLDSRRAQVYVEALIVEVDANRAAELGFQFQGISGQTGSTNLLGIGTNFGTGINSILGATQILAQGVTGLAAADTSTLTGGNFAVAHKLGGIYTLGVLAQALESNVGGNVLSTPNLVMLDNEEAKIVVGENVPFVTGSYTTSTTGTSSPFQTIERKDVGLTLRIKPQIGEGNTVRMTIFQETSAVEATVAAGTANAGPSTTKRSIESTVTVDDGAILVLGGLIQDTYNDTKSKVPLLGDIPWIGGLFRSETRSRNKTNLMVFLRPVVMRTQEATTKLSMDRYDLIRGLQQEGQPEQRMLVPVNGAPMLPVVPPGKVDEPITGTLGLPTREPTPRNTTTPATQAPVVDPITRPLPSGVPLPSSIGVPLSSGVPSSTGLPLPSGVPANAPVSNTPSVPANAPVPAAAPVAVPSPVPSN